MLNTKVYGDAMIYIVKTDEIADNMKVCSDISSHALADIRYHIDNSNMKAVKHICKFFDVEISEFGAGVYVMETEEESKSVKVEIEPKCNSIW